MKREKKTNIKMLRTAKQDIMLSEGQCFYRTPKAYEIWQEEPLYMVKRISQDRVFWIVEK